MATLPDGTPRPPIPDFPPPPPPSLGRKRQRGGNIASKPLPPPPPTNDEDANYIVYPSDDEDTGPGLHNEEEDEGEETERPRKRNEGSDGDFEMASESDFSDFQEPSRKRAKPGDNDDDEDDIDMSDSHENQSKGKGRRVSQKWRKDVYRPSPEDSDDSDLNLHEITPDKRRGKRKSTGKSGSLTSRKSIGLTNGLVRSKSKSTPNLKASEKPAANKIRKSRFLEGSMNDRHSRPGGVPPFKNFQPSEDAEGGVGSQELDNGSISSAALMPPPPRPLPKINNAPQSTPPPPKAKFTFLAPISNWFSKRWRQATQEYEDRERKKEEEVEVYRQVKLVMDRKAKAEQIYAENKVKGINQPTPVDQVVVQEPLATENILQFMDDAPGEIGVAYTTDEIYIAPKLNESRMSVATIRPLSRSYGASPRNSSDTVGSNGVGDPARSSMPNLGAFSSYRDTNPRDTTPLTVDTGVNSDVEGLRSRSRSPAPTPSKPLTKAELKKKERMEKKVEDLKKKLQEAEMEMSVIGVEVTPPTPKSNAKSNAKSNSKKVSTEQERIITIHEDKNNQEEDEADKIVESIMGEPEAIASVKAARGRSKSPFKKLFHIGSKDAAATSSGAASKKGKDAANSTLHNINESGKIKKLPPSSMRGRAGGRGGKAASSSRRGTSEDPS